MEDAQYLVEFFFFFFLRELENHLLSFKGEVWKEFKKNQIITVEDGKEK